jgi:cell division protein FtsL
MIFIACNISMVIVHINNHTRIVRQQYAKQRNEKIKEELTAQKATIIRNLCTCKNHSDIKKYATTQLHMKPIALSQIKSVSFNE